MKMSSVIWKRRNNRVIVCFSTMFFTRLTYFEVLYIVPFAKRWARSGKRAGDDWRFVIYAKCIIIIVIMTLRGVTGVVQTWEQSAVAARAQHTPPILQFLDGTIAEIPTAVHVSIYKSLIILLFERNSQATSSAGRNTLNVNSKHPIHRLEIT